MTGKEIDDKAAADKLAGDKVAADKLAADKAAADKLAADKAAADKAAADKAAADKAAADKAANETAETTETDAIFAAYRKKVFESHPKVDLLYATTDNYLFIRRDEATQYAATLEDKTVREVKKN